MFYPGNVTRSVGKILPLRMAWVSLMAGESTPSSLLMSRKGTGPGIVEFLVSLPFIVAVAAKAKIVRSSPVALAVSSLDGSDPARQMPLPERFQSTLRPVL